MSQKFYPLIIWAMEFSCNYILIFKSGEAADKSIYGRLKMLKIMI